MAGERLVLRPATPGDIPTLVELYRESAACHERLDPALYRVPDADAVRDAIAATLSSAEAAILVAECAGEVIGCTQVSILREAGAASMMRPRRGVEMELVVAAMHRRKGVGTALVQAAQTWAARQGAAFILLNCHAANEAAIQLYKRAGFRTVGLLMRQEPLPDP